MKEFNVTGLCIPEKHYMADISDKLNQIMGIIVKGKYFTITRPRQYGKTTTLYMISRICNKGKEYLALRISFEAIDEPTYQNHRAFIKVFLELLEEKFELLGLEKQANLIKTEVNKVSNMRELSRIITKIARETKEKIVLLIDEVDKSSNNQLFLDFLGMLRDKYLSREAGEDYTFHSVILAGVHDVKSLKLKIRSEDDRKYNSPWNIATDFDVDLSLSKEEIQSMLKDYVETKGVKMDIEIIAERIFYYTSGYPFLVSRICKIIDEKIMKEDLIWLEELLEQAVKILLNESNTNFESLIKNLENNQELYKIAFEMLILGERISYNIDNPVMNTGILFGILKNEDGTLKIYNRIYEQRIYNYMTSKIETSSEMGSYNFRENFIAIDGSLNLEKVLIKFQEFMKKEYSEKDKSFLEKNGRLIFLAFIKPIINGIGFDFKEVQISEEKRLDVVITYLSKQYVIELKLWHGEEAHQRGINQLNDYLERMNLKKGFLVIYDLRKTKHKEWKQQVIEHKGKEIYTIWV